ncbi:Protein F32A5.3 [Aphelenchoides avenae]|nr:Protein F32A5.3 [Aphelenchus avenae]
MRATNAICLMLSVLAGYAAAAGEDDLIKNLPNVTFDVKFKQYSGYLNAGNGGKWKFFYWLTESQSDPEKDPLLIWFTGGPGCSSVGGLFEELGPLYMNRDAQSIYENYASVLFIESPIGVGFSYDTDAPLNYTVGDDLTAQQNRDALADFFQNVQPRYASRKWIITGESYAGVYIPTVTDLVLKRIVAKTFPNPNLQGIAIGNGYMNDKKLTNSLVLWASYHGLIGVREWTQIKATCCKGQDLDSCDFSAHIGQSSQSIKRRGAHIADGNIATGTNPVYSAVDECGKLVAPFLNLPDNEDEYNFYQECYLSDYLTKTKQVQSKPGFTRITQTADKLNYDSTDNQDAYGCWNDDALRKYLNDAAVQKALHIDQKWIDSGVKWQGCNNPLNEHYPVKYLDTTDLFKSIIDNAVKLKDTLPKNFRMLIYNGDVDTVCNFLGDAWHMDTVATNNAFTAQPRGIWHFRNQMAGYAQRYARSLGGDQQLTIDVLTVKGSGHFVPNDRPGPALQMITNFAWGTANYTSTTGIQVTPVPNDLFVADADTTTAKGAAAETTTPKGVAGLYTLSSLAMLAALWVFAV